MVPLMMQRGYKPKGWLGLALGTKMYYHFFPAAVDTDEKFMQQMDALTREIGDRGRGQPRVSEAVPPARAPAALRAPAPAPGPAPAPAPAVAPASSPPRSSQVAQVAPGRGFSPTMQHRTPQTPMVAQQQSSDSLSMVERLLDEAKADRAAMEARLEAKDAILAEQRQEMEAKMEQQRVELGAALKRKTVEQQLEALQSRLRGLHAQNLLTEEETYKVEDQIADYVELPPPLVADQTAGNAVLRMVALSEGIGDDRALARQMRRKFA